MTIERLEEFPWPVPDQQVREALDAAYRDGSWGQYLGPNTAALVDDLCSFFACEHALLCSSGTIGVELALRGCGVGAGDRVVLAGYDFPGNFRAIDAVGARPVLVDISADTWSMDADSLESLPDTAVKALIVSHLHGGLADMPRLMALARQQGWSDQR